jgi:hypothetical protein
VIFEAKKMKPGHKCGKCGWSYPVQHPSSKARKAHNKICGTLEGQIEQKEGDGFVAERVNEKEEFSESNKSKEQVFHIFLL